MIPTRTRPLMAAGYGINPDPAGMLDWSWVDERLVKARNYWLATVKPDHTPHVAPIWGVWVATQLWFGVDPASRKARNIAGQPRVTLNLESGDECVIVEGTARLITDFTTFAPIGAAYGAKYALPPLDPAELPNGLFTLTPHTVLAWLEADFPKTATRFTFP